MEEVLKIFLNEKLLDDILDMINNPDESESSENKLRWAKENKSLSIIRTDNKYVLKVTIEKPQQNSDIKDFFTFAQELDDDIFIKTVEIFNQRFGEKDLLIFNKLLGDNNPQVISYINKFKVIVNEVVNNEINKLQKFLTPNPNKK